MQSSITSPGEALSARHLLESKLAEHVATELDIMLAQVFSDAVASTFAGKEPFALGSVLRGWQGATDAIVSVLAQTHSDPQYLQQVRQRLNSSPLPAAVYDSTHAVLTTAAQGRWNRIQLKRALATALKPDTATTVSTTEGLAEEGMSWKALGAKLARSESTAALGGSVLQSLSQAGYAQKRWVAHHDTATRPDHVAADGQTVDVSLPFIVGGYALMFPADTSGPTDQTAGCRCVMVGIGEPKPVADTSASELTLFSSASHTADDHRTLYAKEQRFWEQRNEMSDAPGRFVEEWSGNGYLELNSSLHEGNLRGVAHIVEDGDEAFAMAPATKQDMVLTRIVPSHFSSVQALLDAEPGTLYESPGYQASTMGADLTQMGFYGIKLEILVKKGTYGEVLNIDAINGSLRGENEWLLNRGATLRVLSADREAGVVKLVLQEK